MKNNPAEERDKIAQQYLLETDSTLVNAAWNFTSAMIAKLGRKRAEGRRGWSDESWPVEDIKKKIVEHIEKGDPVDVANFALFWWHREKNKPGQNDQNKESSASTPAEAL